MMKHKKKLTAVLSASALLTLGFSITAFAGWEKDDDGIWHYYDEDEQLVTDEWRKSGSNWYYLGEDGDMLLDSWVDDDKYVGSDGAMLVNKWIKTAAEDEVDDPSSDGDFWYYFNNKGKKLTDTSKKINGKTYFFDSEGKMEYGWFEKDGDIYYLGEEDDGARSDGKWLWLERPGNDDDEHLDAANALNCSDDSDDPCDDEGWYWFGSSGKMEKGTDKKKINGRYYHFNEHGQMLYEWINDRKVSGTSPATHASLDGNAATTGTVQIEHMLYFNPVEDGWRADGWFEIDGAKDTGDDNDTHWYYFKNGEAKRAELGKDTMIKDDDGPVYAKRFKLSSSKGTHYFAFNEYGHNLTGLQYIPDSHAFYYYDENGWPQTGRVANVECDDDTYEFYFNTGNGKNGQGVNGEKNGYLYFNGKKLTADDDCRLFFFNDKIYLVNNKGKIQKSSKKFDIENSSIAEDKVAVTFNSDDSVKSITLNEGSGTTYTAAELLSLSLSKNTDTNDYVNADGKYEDSYLSIPFIELYDGDVYTYQFTAKGDGFSASENWYDVHETLTKRWK